MAWNGYWTLDGQEVINAARTEVYASGMPAFRPLYRIEHLSEMLGHDDYTDPVTDEAPWYDPDEPDSANFYGCYPIDVTGADSSSRSSVVAESILDGGVPGRLRHGTKSIVFNAVLLGGTEAACETGLRWLSRALIGAPCSFNDSTTQALGTDMTYLSVEPELDEDDSTDPEIQLQPYVRVLHRVVINVGPVVTSKRVLSCGSTAWTVTFTAVSGIPFEYGLPRPLLQGWLDPLVSDPWVPGSDEGTIGSAETVDEVTCGVDLWDPLYDPNCPAAVQPPLPPSVPLNCFEIEDEWARRIVRIPEGNIPAWGEVLPILTVLADDGILRNIRIRFWPDPDGDFDPDDDPCSYISDMIISYIPAEGEMQIDPEHETVYVLESNGHRRRADSLVFNSDGLPFEWPSLSCGYGYVMTLELNPSSTLPVIDLALVPRVK